MKPILLGMNNPLSLAPEHALWPLPPGCTGARLWKMLADVSGASRGDYVRGFERRNLLTGRWTAPAARAATFSPPQGGTIIVLGAEPVDALGHTRRLIHPYGKDGAVWRQVPPPSGRNPWYCNPDHRLVVGLMLEELLCRDQ